jgi:hypothetical protein
VLLLDTLVRGIEDIERPLFLRLVLAADLAIFVVKLSKDFSTRSQSLDLRQSAPGNSLRRASPTTSHVAAYLTSKQNFFFLPFPFVSLQRTRRRGDLGPVFVYVTALRHYISNWWTRITPSQRGPTLECFKKSMRIAKSTVHSPKLKQPRVCKYVT